MNKKKPRKFLVCLWHPNGEMDGVPAYYPKWVSEWPDVVIPYKSHFEQSPKREEAKRFGRDQAIDVARTIRMRTCFPIVTIEED